MLRKSHLHTAISIPDRKHRRVAWRWTYLYRRLEIRHWRFFEKRRSRAFQIKSLSVNDTPISYLIYNQERICHYGRKYMEDILHIYLHAIIVYAYNSSERIDRIIRKRLLCASSRSALLFRSASNRNAKCIVSPVILEMVSFCSRHLSLGRPPSILYSDHPPWSTVIFLAVRVARRGNLAKSAKTGRLSAPIVVIDSYMPKCATILKAEEK